MIYLFDFGGTAMKGIKIDNEGNEIKEYLLSYKERVNIYNVDLKYALGLAKEIVKNEDEKDVEIGLSIPGTVDFEKQKILTESTFVNVFFDIREYFSDLKNVKKIVFNNDGKCATLGEYKYGQEEKCKNMILLTIGTSIGCGCIMNGELFMGSHSSSMSIERTFRSLDTGIEDFSQANIYGTAKNVLYYARENNLDFRTFDGKKLSQLYLDNEENAVKCFEKWTDGLAKLIINTQLVIDTEKIIIGGGISSFEPFIDLLRNKCILLAKELKIETPIIESAKLKNKAGCYGALYSLRKFK